MSRQSVEKRESNQNFYSQGDEEGEAQIFPILQKCAILNPNPHSFYMSVLEWQYGEGALSCNGLEFLKSPNIHIVERIDQGHLHPLLEHPRQTLRLEFAPWLCTVSGHSSKELFKQLIITIRNIYMRSSHGSPRCMCYMNIPYMNTQELHKNEGQIVVQILPSPLI
jgi:hypothetical protein